MVIDNFGKNSPYGVLLQEARLEQMEEVWEFSFI
jgi:hypothetical protein